MLVMAGKYQDSFIQVAKHHLSSISGFWYSHNMFDMLDVHLIARFLMQKNDYNKEMFFLEFEHI